MRTRSFVACILSAGTLLAGARAAEAACVISDISPTTSLPTTPIGQGFSFAATDDCVTLTFTSGAFSATPLMGLAHGAGAHWYTVSLSSTDWLALAETATTFSWTITGTDATGIDTDVDTTNELDFDRDGRTRSSGDCDDDPTTGSPRTYYPDADADGYGDGAAAISACSPPPGYLRTSNDCDDTAPTVHPKAADVCENVIDDDCDGRVDECLADAEGKISGSGRNQRFGYDLAVGNVDGWGGDDIMAGAPYHDGGEVSVLHAIDPGDTQDPLYQVFLLSSEPGSGEAFGSSVATGDVDGDGYVDGLVGAKDGATAYLWLGPVTTGQTTGTTPVWIHHPAGSFQGTADSLAGTDVDVVPDVDGDGVCDVVIGAEGTDSFSGAVYVASCDSSGTLDLTSNATYSYYGGALEDLGHTDTDVGDQNGDGIGELALYSASGVYIIEGGQPGGIYSPGVAASAIISSSDVGFGERLASADYDGDGTMDLLVGSLGGTDATGTPNLGLVYGFLGPLSGSVGFKDAYVTWVSGDVRGLGAGGIDAADADGDGNTDVIFGAPYVEPHNSGAVYLGLEPVSGIVDVATLLTIPSVGYGDALGWSVAFVPDWDGDAMSEIAVGSIRAKNQAGIRTGEIDVLYSEHLY